MLRFGRLQIWRLETVLKFESWTLQLLMHLSRFRHRREVMTMMPNESPEPTADGAFSSAVAVHAASQRWLSFFRSAAWL